MFHCTDQPCTLCFPIGLVKTESDFIVRSVETGLGRWTLVVAVISAHAFFFDFPMTLRIQALCHLILRSQNFQLTRILLVPCCTWKSVPTSISGFWEFLRSLGVICYDRWVLSECYKITSTIGVSWTQSVPFVFLTYIFYLFYSMNFGLIVKRRNTR